MLIFYHLIASLCLFVEDGLSRSLDASPELNEDSIRSMLSTDEKVVAFDGLESTGGDPPNPKKGNPSDANLEFMKEIGNEKILREIFITCAERNNSIPFLTNKFDFDCYPVGDQGPCSGEDEWLVVTDEKDDVDFPWSICKKNPCHAYPGRIFYRNDCVEKSVSSLVCHKGMELEIDISGRGVCVCSEGLLTVLDDKKFPHCYQEFLQGPCEEGEQLVMDDALRPESTLCVPTNCEFTNQTKWSSGECLDSVMCGEEGIVVFQDGKLDCAISVRQLINVPFICEDGEAKDASGNCQKVYENLGRTSRSPSGGNISFSRQTLKRLMCSKHPNKFNC